MRNIELPILFGVLILGAFFRFYLITEIPPGLYPDEAANGNNAMEALETWEFKVFYPENNGREGLFINLQALAIWVFGAEPWALRLVSAIIGTLTILGTYLLAKELFRDSEPESMNQESGRAPARDSYFVIHNSGLIALLSAFLLATSYWHVNFSRIGFRAIMVPFFATFGIYFLLLALRRGGIFESAAAGIFIGLGFHAYIAFRFVPFALILPLGVYIYRWLKSQGSPQACSPCLIAVFAFAALITALPLGLYFSEHPGDFFGRGGQVSIFSGDNPAFEFIKSNALTFQMFFWRGDCNPRHNLACRPQLFWPVAAFFAIGFMLAAAEVARALKNIISKGSVFYAINNEPVHKTFAAAMLLSWFVFMTLPATLTNEGLPHALRSIGLIPPVMILSGWGAAFIWKAISGYLSRLKEKEEYKNYQPQVVRIQKEAAILFLAILAFAVSQTHLDYFFRFPISPYTYDAFSTDLRQIGAYINDLPNKTKKFVIVNPSDVLIRNIPSPAQTPMFISGTFTEKSRLAKNVFYVNSVSEISLSASEDAAIIPMNPRLTPEIKNRFPEAAARIMTGFLSFEKTAQSRQ